MSQCEFGMPGDCSFTGTRKCRSCEKVSCELFHMRANSMCLDCTCKQIVREAGCPHNYKNWIVSEKNMKVKDIWVMECGTCHIEISGSMQI